MQTLRDMSRMERGKTLLEARQEVKHDFFQLSIRCFRDLAISPGTETLVLFRKCNHIFKTFNAIMDQKDENPEVVVSLNSWLPNGCKQFLVLTTNMLQEGSLKLCDLAGFHLVEVAPHTSIDDCDLFLNGHGSWG